MNMTTNNAADANASAAYSAGYAQAIADVRSATDVASELGVHVSTVKRLAAKHRIGVVVGNRIYAFWPNDIIDIRARLRVDNARDIA